jgi:hypothetical protein
VRCAKYEEEKDATKSYRKKRAKKSKKKVGVVVLMPPWAWAAAEWAVGVASRASVGDLIHQELLASTAASTCALPCELLHTVVPVLQAGRRAGALPRRASSLTAQPIANHQPSTIKHARTTLTKNTTQTSKYNSLKTSVQPVSKKGHEIL